MSEEVHKEWLKAKGDEILRLNYALDNNSIVIDAGGYEGSWSEKIYNKYNCTLYIFEPVESFYKEIKDKFRCFSKINVLNYGVAGSNKSAEIHIDDKHKDSTSLFTKGGRVEVVSLRSIEDIILDIGSQVDLLKLNVEGSEYEILDHLIGSGLIKKVNNLQIQFHTISEDSSKRRDHIRDLLELTHDETYCYPFIWENWRIK
jgi:FkbM family methyltransferase